ncbi:cyclopropane-fatty-acyl-phospholipid synthase family protein [Vibrio sp. SS-MA-C1-2]|uniref:SAM-dependent methyltransferase n=1 Tax=Vibrio sp. SS-MA-C1-2 TaxID=2908646 RepID=UPI001F3FB4CB|nr:cyclopropane-fatty-acyl-phospholipid synthase family protein [Vibrio sp. SS-MA-C1-2]UJF18362.1 cyclopropane-fatty-acyl-phospholipid synthase family protein [Vibrio sp. SS-MA-C1-2]
MNDVAQTTRNLNQSARKLTLLETLFRKSLFKALESLKQVKLVIIEDFILSNSSKEIKDSSRQFVFGLNEQHIDGVHLTATIIIHDPRAYQKIALGGDIGASEAFIDGLWSTPDLTQVIRVMAREQGTCDQVEGGFSKLIKWGSLLEHKLNHNSQAGSKKNILAHYDLGNEMYKLFLDSNMLYSSAIYPSETSTLEEAQINKMDLICQRLELKENETLLEIGTGWGGLAIHAAKYYGVNVTTTTISDAQYEYTKARVEQLGLNDKVTLLKQDYRLLTGQFDKLVSIEMIEAVGYQYFDQFFDQCNSLLKPTGKMLLQAITIADQRFESYKNGVDFIQKYIFPGGFLPSVSVMSEKVRDRTDMLITEIHDIGIDYAKTLNEWQKRFNEKESELKELGYGDDFIRLWRFYFSYCEGGFLERKISTVHMVSEKPLYRVTH